MDFKIYKKGNYIFAIDENGKQYEEHTSEVRVNRDSENGNTFRIHQLLNAFGSLDISEILKEDGSAYSLTEWVDFYTAETGGAGDGAAATTGASSNTIEDADGDALEINADGSINASAGDLQRVKAQGDLKRTYAKLDVGTADERFDTIVYESAILGYKVTVQFNYQQLTVNGVTFYNQTDDVATKSNI